MANNKKLKEAYSNMLSLANNKLDWEKNHKNRIEFIELYKNDIVYLENELKEI